MRKKAKEIKPIDWGDIEGDYCAGVLTISEIARWHGVSRAAIQKRAKQKEWQRKATPGHVERVAPVREPMMPGDSAKVAERARDLASRMIDELDAATAHHGELEDMICTEESDPRRRGALLKALSLGERAMTLKNISQTLKTLAETGEAPGKKAQRQANAEKSASGGKFAAPSAPRMMN